MNTPDLILEARHICKHFPGVQALDEVDLSVCYGEVHALVGANGAGKSTLINILSGYMLPDSGEMFVAGRRISLHSPADAIRMGIATVHQEIDITGELSVAQNIFLGNERRFESLGLINRRRMNTKACEILQTLNVDINPSTLMNDLSTGSQQMIMIAAALERQAKVIIFDEPTSALSSKESESLFSQIRSLQDRGISIIYISHYLDEIFEIAQRATVVRDGRLSGVLDLAGSTKDNLIRLMIGREVKETRKQENYSQSEVVLSVRDLSTNDGKVTGVGFSLHKGEILGFYGAVGSGRSEMAKAVCLGDKRDGGEVRLRGCQVFLESAGQAFKTGLVYSPQDRKGEGLLMELSVLQNITISILSRLSRIGVIRRKISAAVALNYVRKLNIATPSINKAVKHLSGGNQQKVVISKGLATESEILVLDEPTIGIDVATKEEILEIVLQLSREGKSVVLISSEANELMKVCDRIIVMKQGSIQKEFTREQFDKQSMLAAAVGGDE